jgi:hypothetical protein
VATLRIAARSELDVTVICPRPPLTAIGAVVGAVAITSVFGRFVHRRPLYVVCAAADDGVADHFAVCARDCPSREDETNEESQSDF